MSKRDGVKSDVEEEERKREAKNIFCICKRIQSNHDYDDERSECIHGCAITFVVVKLVQIQCI